MTVEARYDVVVAGAGMAGLLTALASAGRGAAVLLIERDRLGGGQSGQSHGYLHQGYAYGPAESQLPTLFARARTSWDALTAELTPVTTGSTVAFSGTAAMRRAQEFWRSSGLDVRPVAAASWLGDGPFHCFHSTERTYHVGRLLRGLGARIASAGVEFAPGTVRRVVDGPDGVTTEYAGPDGRTTRVRSRAVVLAAGAGATGVLARSGLPGVVRRRKAYMLLLRGELPVVSAVFPEHEQHGLFLASRTGHPAGTTWLVSDFQSFDSGPGDPHQLAGWWARRVLTTLRGVVDAEVLAGVRTLSGYSAVKSGLLPGSGTVAHALSRDFFGGRVVVTSPSKLTLAPLAAESAMRFVCANLGLPFRETAWDPVARAPGGRPAHGPGPGGSAREVWETELEALKDPDLPGVLPDIRTLSSLFSSDHPPRKDPP